MTTDFFNLLNSLDNKKYMTNFITYLISPVITGIKPSSTITVTKEGRNLYSLWDSHGKDFLQSLNLKHIVLRETENSKILLIYNSNCLKFTIYTKNTLSFLKKLNYRDDMNLNEMLNHLKSRYNVVHCPHELGIFLGIPLDDVEIFMNCSSSKCLLCGYWKVYKEKEKAEKIFNYYDSSKKLVMNHILEGKSLYELYKNSYNIYSSVNF